MPSLRRRTPLRNDEGNHDGLGPLTDGSTVTSGLVEMINVYLADNRS
jgi:hypothetical protein